MNAIHALSQLSYGPEFQCGVSGVMIEENQILFKRRASRMTSRGTDSHLIRAVLQCRPSTANLLVTVHAANASKVAKLAEVGALAQISELENLRRNLNEKTVFNSRIDGCDCPGDSRKLNGSGQFRRHMGSGQDQESGFVSPHARC